MSFLGGVKRCSKLDHIRNEAIREDLQVNNLKQKLKHYKQRYKEHLECQIPGWPNKSGNTNLQDTGVWVDPGRDGWRIFEGGTGSTLPMPCCENDDYYYYYYYCCRCV